MDVIHKESLCIMCGCCVSECNSMEADPDFLGPAALAKGMRFVGDAARPGDGRAAPVVLAGARDLGLHALLLLPGALPEGRRPARRDREARRRGDAGRHRLGHGGEARPLVRHLVQDDGLAARDRARPEDAGRRQVAEGGQVRDGAPEARQGAAARPAARRQARGRGARALRPRQGAGSPGSGGHRAVGEGALAARARRGRRASAIRTARARSRSRALPEKETAE